MVFVDGAIRRVGEPGSRVKEGGVGIVLVDNNNRRGSIIVSAKYIPPDDKVTNQRMEILAIQYGVLAAEKYSARPKGTPIHIWSDSQYAIGTIGPSDWSPTKNLDIIVPTQRLLKACAPVHLHHVRSHLERKTGGEFPDFVFHELADVVATGAIKKAGDGAHVARHTKLDPACVACQKFPCWQRTDPLKTQTIEPGGEACAKFLPWGPQWIQDFNREDVLCHMSI